MSRSVTERARAGLVLAGALSLLLVPASAPAVADEGRAAPRSLGTGHLRDRSRVLAVAFSADGERIVSADAEGSFTLRDAATRKVLAAFSPVGSDALRFPCFAFAPDATRVYMASSGANEVRVHDTKTGEVTARFAKLEAGVRQLLASPDGKLLAVRHESAVSLLDASTGALVRKHALAATIGLAFSADSKRLVASAKDAIFFFDAASGEPARRKLVWHKKRDGDDEDEEDVNLGSHAPVAMALSPDGKTLATAGGRSIRLWDLEEGTLDAELEAEDFVGPIVFSPDGKRIASGGEDEKVHVWSVAKQKEIGKLEGHRDPVTSVAYSPDGKILLSGSKDCTVRAWDAKTGDELEEFTGHTAGIRSVAIDMKGKRIVTAGEDKRVCEWDVKTGELRHEYEGTRAFIAPDGELIAIEHGREIRLESDGDRVRTIEATTEVRLAGFSADGTQLVAYTEGSRPLAFIYSAKDGEEVQRVKLGREAVACAALDPSRGTLCWIDAKDAVRTLDLETGAIARLGDRLAKELAFSPDGKELAVLDPEGKLLILDARTGEEKRALGPASTPISFGRRGLFAGGVLHGSDKKSEIGGRAVAAAFSRDGALLATGDAAGAILVHEVP